MSFESYQQHFVCTHQQTRAIITQHDRFWLGDCGRRTIERKTHSGRGLCAEIRMLKAVSMDQHAEVNNACSLP